MSKKRKNKWEKQYGKIFEAIIFKEHPIETPEIKVWRESQLNKKKTS